MKNDWKKKIHILASFSYTVWSMYVRLTVFGKRECDEAQSVTEKTNKFYPFCDKSPFYSLPQMSIRDLNFLESISRRSISRRSIPGFNGNVTEIVISYWMRWDLWSVFKHGKNENAFSRFLSITIYLSNWEHQIKSSQSRLMKSNIVLNWNHRANFRECCSTILELKLRIELIILLLSSFPLRFFFVSAGQLSTIKTKSKSQQQQFKWSNSRTIE